MSQGSERNNFLRWEVALIAMLLIQVLQSPSLTATLNYEIHRIVINNKTADRTPFYQPEVFRTSDHLIITYLTEVN